MAKDLEEFVINRLYGAELSPMELGEMWEGQTGRRLNMGRLYAIVVRLEQEGTISSRSVPGGPERGGHAKLLLKLN